MKTIEQHRKVLAKNLQKLLDEKRITQTDMAKDLGFAETTVSSWLLCKKYPRLDKIQKMADYFHVKRSDLTEEKPTNIIELKNEFVKVPILGAIACGEPLLAEQNIEGYMYELTEDLPNGTVFGLIAKGNSMEPTIPNGSKVLIREQNNVEYGEIAAVLVNGNTEATLKRIKKQGNMIILMPDNPEYEPYIITENNPARIIGKAIRVTKDL
ncbi:LexA family protein [Schinkia azotoformans]|uniref:LexA family protein n=1 Tax=Schinkia azotoformans TaxID=1454 RepID=UPI002DBFCCEA|nr:XRE family transcriptional regulator [Schinkia azotoformans]MEC1714995.1 XRE family transcriptional regulator [Schinkia azotoformans]MEC1740229.1 XRE family transcriptional regulator [Schinkia azotoformans]MEC1747138.1 XRE family transcriptional regulator [Schinkia azotoformans]MEC1766116.1 XRE family transcriptional regulator [Schinkia azotoformans]MEC1785326.1 XRE family transcriptional regulator [Schinkia azotoformans]